MRCEVMGDPGRERWWLEGGRVKLNLISQFFSDVIPDKKLFLSCKISKPYVKE